MHNVILCVLILLVIVWLMHKNGMMSYGGCGCGCSSPRLCRCHLKRMRRAPVFGYAADPASSSNASAAASSVARAAAAESSVVRSPSANEDVVASANYNTYLQSVALEPTIKDQHKEWLGTMNINLQPRMYSIRDDCDDGETPRWGLLKKDYSNVINDKQNISIPSGRICAEGDGGNSRWGGYGIGLCPVQRNP